MFSQNNGSIRKIFIWNSIERNENGSEKDNHNNVCCGCCGVASSHINFDLKKLAESQFGHRIWLTFSYFIASFHSSMRSVIMEYIVRISMCGHWESGYSCKQCTVVVLDLDQLRTNIETVYEQASKREHYIYAIRIMWSGQQPLKSAIQQTEISIKRKERGSMLSTWCASLSFWPFFPLS